MVERELGERAGELEEADLEAISLEWRRLESVHYDEYLSGSTDLEEQRRRRAAGLLAHLGLPRRAPAELDEWFAAFLTGYREAWALFDDVLPALDVLSGRGLPLGVITNADATLQRGKLAGLGIAERTPLVVASSEVGAAKPRPEIFHAAAERVGAASERIAYVGDRLDTDARGARDAGMVGIWLKRDPGRAPAGDVPTIASLAELAKLFD